MGLVNLVEQPLLLKTFQARVKPFVVKDLVSDALSVCIQGLSIPVAGEVKIPGAIESVLHISSLFALLVKLCFV